MRVVDDYLPAAMAEDLWARFALAPDWQPNTGTNVYGPAHQSFDGHDLPRDGEEYRMAFGSSGSLERDPQVEEVVRMVGGRDRRCYRMGPGDHLRVHRDEYFGGDGSATLYLTRRWSVDWGGLLLVEEAGGTRVVCPRMNRLVVIGHDPHAVSAVAPWAQEPRYALSVFGLRNPGSGAA